MLGMNGTSAKDFRSPRYLMQWLTTYKDGTIALVGFCIRDSKSFGWETVFEHKDESVCKKMLKILNEG